METRRTQTKSVERPVRAVDLFIASLDALTSLEGSSTLSAWIDSDARKRKRESSYCWPLSVGRFARGGMARLNRQNKAEEKREIPG